MKKIHKYAALAVMLIMALPAAGQDLTSGNMQILPLDEAASADYPEFDPEIAAENGYTVTQDESGDYHVKSSASFTMQAILDLFLHFMFNLLISWIIVWFFYYRRGGQQQYFFTFMIFSSAMFLLLFVMNNLSLQIGFTLGLFAIFGMIRYRTETVPVREMTYLFIIIAISIINGIGADVPFAEILMANTIMVLLIWILESAGIMGQRKSEKVILYDRIELITPDRRAELKEDLEKRLGLKIDGIEIGSVDFLKDSAYIKITHKLAKGESNTIDKAIKIKTYEH